MAGPTIPNPYPAYTAMVRSVQIMRIGISKSLYVRDEAAMPARAVPRPGKSGRPLLRSMGSEVPIGMRTELPMRILLLVRNANHQSCNHVTRILSPVGVRVNQKLG